MQFKMLIMYIYIYRIKKALIILLSLALFSGYTPCYAIRGNKDATI